MSSAAISKCLLLQYYSASKDLRFRIMLTFKAQSILNLISSFFSEKKRLDISCDSAARQIIHVKCRVFFSLKKIQCLIFSEYYNKNIAYCSLTFKVTHRALDNRNKHHALDDRSKLRALDNMNKQRAWITYISIVRWII